MTERSRRTKTEKRPSKAAPANRRASPDVVKKRRAARHFNELLAEAGAVGQKLDGRTEKRRKRLLRELGEGKVQSTKRLLKPIDVLVRVQALLDLGEPLASIKKVCKPSRPVPPSRDVVEGLKRLHAAYGFHPEAYAFVGLGEAMVAKAGISEKPSGHGRPTLARRGAEAAKSRHVERAA